jgi:membrane-associated phospholipid phosphatase
MGKDHAFAVSEFTAPMRARFGVFALAVALSLPSAALAESKAVTTAGDVGRFAVPVAAAAISYFKDDTQGLWQLGGTLAVTMGTTVALKYGVNRKRPDGGDHSFPSGHSASAFAGASYLQFRYGWKYGVPAYLVGLGVGYSRVQADKHYWTDVLGSFALATAAGALITEPYRERIQLGAVVDGASGTYGITAALRF